MPMRFQPRLVTMPITSGLSVAPVFLAMIVFNNSKVETLTPPQIVAPSAPGISLAPPEPPETELSVTVQLLRLNTPLNPPPLPAPPPPPDPNEVPLPPAPPLPPVARLPATVQLSSLTAAAATMPAPRPPAPGPPAAPRPNTSGLFPPAPPLPPRAVFPKIVQRKSSREPTL